MHIIIYVDWFADNTVIMLFHIVCVVCFFLTQLGSRQNEWASDLREAQQRETYTKVSPLPSLTAQQLATIKCNHSGDFLYGFHHRLRR